MDSAGSIEGYRHPTISRDDLLSDHCFDTVFNSVENYRELITPYIGFLMKNHNLRRISKICVVLFTIYCRKRPIEFAIVILFETIYFRGRNRA